MKEKMVIYQGKTKGRNNSFFYEGVIARMGGFCLEACGDIEVENKEGETIYARGGAFANQVEILDDQDMENEDLVWVNNNWFQVVETETGEDVLGEPIFTYDEGIAKLKQIYEENYKGEKG